ncbi:MAG: hypothetical protein LRY42_00380 [Candidatus Pacebacteria bacterium]|nr:hypothetical protein [Candidatus Paceibacterota bacterium]
MRKFFESKNRTIQDSLQDTTEDVTKEIADESVQGTPPTRTTPNPTPRNDNPPRNLSERIANPQCRISGCSGHICESVDEPSYATTCEWREEYACYKQDGVTCGINAQGVCGWIPEGSIAQCIADVRSFE